MMRAHGPDLKVARRCLIEEEFGILKTMLEDGDISFILDGGGYIGTAAIAFARMFPQATIVTIEPYKPNFELLQHNVSKYPNIVPIHGALVGADRQVTLHDRDTGDWGLTIASKAKDKSLERMHAIEGVSVDTLMQRFKINRIDILKLDIEGAEKEVLETSEKWLPRTRAIIAEMHDRIIPGCSEEFNKATRDMKRVEMAGEKSLAVR